MMLATRKLVRRQSARQRALEFGSGRGTQREVLDITAMAISQRCEDGSAKAGIAIVGCLFC
jgi:hypothetical protein